MSKLSGLVRIADQLGNLETIRDVYLGNFCIFLCKKRYMPVLEVFYGFFSDRKNRYILSALSLLLHELKQV